MRPDAPPGLSPLELSPFCRAVCEAPVDLLIGHSLYMSLDPKQLARMQAYPPLATLYAAAVVGESGRSLAFFDACFADGPTDFEVALDVSRPRIVAIYEDSFNFLTKMCLARMRQACVGMIRAARQRGIPVLVSGPDASDHPAAYLEAGAAAVIIGEGEQTLREVVEAWLGGGGTTRASPSGARSDRARPDPLTDPGRTSAARRVAGLAWLQDGELRRSELRKPSRALDRLPEPARALVDIDRYRQAWREAHGRFEINMVSTRGCPYGCNWCARPIWGRRYNLRSPEPVAREMVGLGRELGAETVWFADDIFGLEPGWVEAFAVAVEKLGGGPPFRIQCRVDLVDAGYARALARAGCEEVWLGVESGSQEVLDGMEKGIRVADVAPALAALRKEGIRVGYFLQLGYPGESWRDIRATADLVRKTLPDAIGVSVSYPLPGTPFHQRVSEQLGPRRHWRDSQDLAMLFEGSYDTGFYRELHGLLHAELEARWAQGRDGAGVAAGRGPTALDEIMQRWAELDRLEPGRRSSSPTGVSVAGADVGA